MNTNCIFTVLLYSNIKTIIKSLIVCNQLNTEYLWKLLCYRDFKSYNLTRKDKTFYKIYEIYYIINNLLYKYIKNSDKRFNHLLFKDDACFV